MGLRTLISTGRVPASERPCRGLADWAWKRLKSTRNLASALTPKLYLDAGASQTIQLCSIHVVRVENRGQCPKHNLYIHKE